MVQSEGDDIFGYISCLYSIFSVLPATCIFLHDWSMPTSITAVPCWYLSRVPCWRSDPLTRLRVLGRLLDKMYQPQEHGYFGASPVLSHATCGWLVQKMFPRMTFALLAVVSANYFLSFRSCVGKQTNLVVLTAFCFLYFQALCLWQPAECRNSSFWVGGSYLFLLQ